MNRLICLFALTCAIGAAQTISGAGVTGPDINNGGALAIGPGGGSGSAPVSTVVQSNSAVATAGSATSTVAFASPVTAGNLIVVIESAFGLGTPSSTAGDTFATAGAQPSNGVNQGVWYTCNAKGGATTISATGGRAVHLHIIEIHGAPTTTCLDQTGTGGASSVSVTSLSVSTSGSVAQAKEIVIAAFDSNSSSCTSIAAGTGDTRLQQTLSTTSASGNWPTMTEQITATTGLSGVQTATGTCNSASSFWNANIATFKLN